MDRCPPFPCPILGAHSSAIEDFVTEQSGRVAEIEAAVREADAGDFADGKPTGAAAASALERHAASIAADDPQTAAEMLRRIKSAIDLVGREPTVGVEGRVPITRELAVAGAPYRIVFRVRDGVEVLRILFDG